MNTCAGRHAHTSGLGLHAPGILVIELCRTPVGSRLGQSLTCSPLRQSIRDKQKMSCRLANRKQSGQTTRHQTRASVPHAQGLAQWEPQSEHWAGHAAAWLKRLSMLCRRMHIVGTRTNVI